VANALNNEKFRILVVDDEPSVGDALRLVLESNGYEVVLVTKGLEAIQQARKHRFAFGIVDLFLADLCGFQVITEIHKHQPELPLILVSGHGTPQLFEKAKKLGAMGGLSKPFLPEEIITIITNTLAQ
jgi:DNA-binding NtrC family response regulator